MTGSSKDGPGMHSLSEASKDPLAMPFLGRLKKKVC